MKRFSSPLETCPCDQCMGRDPDIDGQANDALEALLERAEEEQALDADLVMDFMAEAQMDIYEIHNLLDWNCPDCKVGLLKIGVCPSCGDDYSTIIGG